MNGRPLRIALALVAGAAVAGFLIGTQRPDRPEVPTAPAVAGGAAGEAPAAVSYAEMRERAGARQGSGGTVDTLAAEALKPEEREPRDLLARSLAARAERRAFDGAPPLVPHAIDQQETTDCLGCRGEGIEVGGRMAPAPPHPPYASCTQCHLEAASAELAPREGSPESLFVGVEAPAGGPRAWQGAPPRIPHATTLRSDCLACHGPAGAPGMRTTHPERRSCTQCHAPSAKLEQHVVYNEPEVDSP